jgi:hypothetical protein
MLQAVEMETFSDECEAKRQSHFVPNILKKNCDAKTGRFDMSDAALKKACTVNGKDLCAGAGCDHASGDVITKVVAPSVEFHSKDAWKFLRNMKLQSGTMTAILKGGDTIVKGLSRVAEISNKTFAFDLTSHLIWRKVICAWVKNNKDTWKYWLPLREPNHAHCRNSSQPLRQVCSGHGACVAASAANAFPPSTCQCNAGFSGSTCERTDGGKSAAYALAVTKQVNRFKGCFIEV